MSAGSKDAPGSFTVSFRMPGRAVSKEDCWEEVWAKLQKEGWEMLKHGEQLRSHYLLPDGHTASCRNGSYIRRLTAKDGSLRAVYRTRGEVMHHIGKAGGTIKKVAAPAKKMSSVTKGPWGKSSSTGLGAPDSFRGEEWSSDDLGAVAELPSCPTVLEDIVHCSGAALEPESTCLGNAGWGPRARDKAGLSRWSPRADRDWIKESRQTRSPAVLECTYTLPEAGSIHQVLPLPSLDMPGEPVLPALPALPQSISSAPKLQQNLSGHHAEVRESADAVCRKSNMLCSKDKNSPKSDLQRWVPPMFIVQQAATRGSTLSAPCADTMQASSTVGSLMITDDRDSEDERNNSCEDNDLKGESAYWVSSDNEELRLPGTRQQVVAQDQRSSFQPSPDKVSLPVAGVARKSAMGFLHHNRPASEVQSVGAIRLLASLGSIAVSGPPEKRQKVVRTVSAGNSRSEDSTTADVVAARVQLMPDGKRLKGRSRKPYSWEEGAVKELPGPTLAEQRRLVDEFRTSPRSQIRDPFRDLSERDKLLYTCRHKGTVTETNEIGTVGAAPAGVVSAHIDPTQLPHQRPLSSDCHTKKAQCLSLPRRRNYPQPKPRQVWTEEEHKAFTDALQCYGRNWVRVAQSVGTKTTEQTRSHAQKYFRRLQRAGQVALVPPPARPSRQVMRSESEAATSVVDGKNEEIATEG